MNEFDIVVFRERFSYPFHKNGIRMRKIFSAGEPFRLKISPGINDCFCDLTTPAGETAQGVSRARFDVVSSKDDLDEFRWVAFTLDKLVIFSNGDLKAKRKMRKNERIRVLAQPKELYFDITTAMDWKTTLLATEFVFVVAPKPVIESFPEPFPGVQYLSDRYGSRWKIPKYYNGIPVVGGTSIGTPTKEKRTPLIRLSLSEATDKKLFYQVASFGLE